jgi:hypothetical protein
LDDEADKSAICIDDCLERTVLENNVIKVSQESYIIVLAGEAQSVTIWLRYLEHQ